MPPPLQERNKYMNKELLERATQEQLKNALCSIMDMVEETDNKLYKEIHMMLYSEINGYHFDEALSKMAVSEMKNEDGTTGEHFTVEEAIELGNRFNIEFTKFNKYDWYYVLNMIFSDYYGAVPNEVGFYVELAKKFLMDKDGIDGKAFKYWSQI